MRLNVWVHFWHHCCGLHSHWGQFISVASARQSDQARERKRGAQMHGQAEDRLPDWFAAAPAPAHLLISRTHQFVKLACGVNMPRITSFTYAPFQGHCGPSGGSHFKSRTLRKSLSLSSYPLIVVQLAHTPLLCTPNHRSQVFFPPSRLASVLIDWIYERGRERRHRGLLHVHIHTCSYKSRRT